jgi:hypothetical protein
MKKSQIKMIETIGVLLAFLFIFILGVQFYGQTQLKELEQLKVSLVSYDSQKLADEIFQTQLFSCTVLGSNQGPCIDEYKLNSFIQLTQIQNPSQAQVNLMKKIIDQWGYMNISVHNLQPYANDEFNEQFSSAQIQNPSVQSPSTHSSTQVLSIGQVQSTDIYVHLPKSFQTKSVHYIPVIIHNPFTLKNRLSYLQVQMYG